MAKTPTLFHYEKCSTCVKARKWLDAKAIAVTLRPIVDERPGVEELRSLWTRSGLPLKKFFNTSGLSYRALPEKDRLETLSDDAKLALLAADGKLVKRPILDAGKTVLVGFDADAWAVLERR
jgi:arsenate reductase